MLRLVWGFFALCLSVLVGLPAQAQLVREHDAQGLRSFHGQASRIRRSFQSDAEARAVFKHILAVSGLAGMEDRITLRASAETQNAEAFVEGDKEERLIFYNAVFMQEIARKTKEYWSMVAILAHEVGHHIRLHTVIPGRDHEFELEADYQAGFILRRMGATLDQTQAAFRSIAPEAATPSHPGRAQRVQAATLGWADGTAQPFSALGSPAPAAAAPKQQAQATEDQIEKRAHAIAQSILEAEAKRKAEEERSRAEKEKRQAEEKARLAAEASASRRQSFERLPGLSLSGDALGEVVSGNIRDVRADKHDPCLEKCVGIPACVATQKEWRGFGDYQCRLYGTIASFTKGTPTRDAWIMAPVLNRLLRKGVE